MACLTHLVTVGLRRPYWRFRNARVARRADLTSELDAQPTNGWWAACDSHDHPLTWLLAWTSQTHVLGCLILLNNDWVSALPAVVVGLTVELVLWPFSPADWQERLRQFAEREHDLDQQYGPPPNQPTHLDQQPDQQRAGQTAEQTADQAAEQMALTIDARNWQRGATQGQLPTGENFMTGWIRYQL
ncbi:MAG: hypothetical protein IT423_09595, partial [Pirellulaceae bacterium]|nr:hypothetical protein [Pirellulaceae bacterium]